jgi:hypothetical protein
MLLLIAALVVAHCCRNAALVAQPLESGSVQDYVVIATTEMNSDGLVGLTYHCALEAYNYDGAPLNIYLLAIENPMAHDGACSIDDVNASGSVRVFGPNMSGTYLLEGGLQTPTFSGIAFPSVFEEGSLVINTAAAGIYHGLCAIAVVFTYQGTGEYLRTDGLPVEVSNIFTPFQYHVKLLKSTLHVGDGYDPYMATWEVTHPEGIRVEREFYLDHAATGPVLLRAGYWATLYDNNPVYINGEFVGYLQAIHNYNIWAWSQVRLSPSLFHAGANTIVFKSGLRPPSMHYDNYMVKGWEIFYN